jgi:hypothetical protein
MMRFARRWQVLLNPEVADSDYVFEKPPRREGSATRTEKRKSQNLADEAAVSYSLLAGKT